jgi:hypothetical protein
MEKGAVKEHAAARHGPRRVLGPGLAAPEPRDFSPASLTRAGRGGLRARRRRYRIVGQRSEHRSARRGYGGGTPPSGGRGARICRQLPGRVTRLSHLARPCPARAPCTVFGRGTRRCRASPYALRPSSSLAWRHDDQPGANCGNSVSASTFGPLEPITTSTTTYVLMAARWEPKSPTVCRKPTRYLHRCGRVSIATSFAFAPRASSGKVWKVRPSRTISRPPPAPIQSLPDYLVRHLRGDRHWSEDQVASIPREEARHLLNSCYSREQSSHRHGRSIS